MNFESNSMKSPKRRYERPSYSKRLELIRMVQKDGESIKKSAQVLGIKNSTAKLIISRFRTEGKIYRTAEQLRISQPKEEKKDRECYDQKIKISRQQMVLKENEQNNTNHLNQGQSNNVWSSMGNVNIVFYFNVYPFDNFLNVNCFQ